MNRSNVDDIAAGINQAHRTYRASRVVVLEIFVFSVAAGLFSWARFLIGAWAWLVGFGTFFLLSGAITNRHIATAFSLLVSVLWGLIAGVYAYHLAVNYEALPWPVAIPVGVVATLASLGIHTDGIKHLRQ